MDNTQQTHVVVGAGAVGGGVAQRLAAHGHRVKIVTRSGSGPAMAGIERIAADAGDRRGLTEIASGAHAIYNCANPAYDRWAADWPPLAASMLDAAEATGARLVIMSNLYGAAAGSSPMRATDPLDPPSKKGAIRAQMWNEALAAHEAGRIRATEARASDFFGPGLGQSGHFGDRAAPRLIAGKPMSFIGKRNVVHSWSYVGDTCATLAALGTDDRSLGRAWHVPTLAPMTAQAMANAISHAAGHGDAKVKQIPTSALRLVGMFSKLVRELPEMVYQFTAPFVIDADDTAATFGLAATPLDQQVEATIASYRVASSGMQTAASV